MDVGATKSQLEAATTQPAATGLKIRTIETFFLQASLAEPFGWSKAWTDIRTAALVRVTAQDGTQGWGEAGVMATPSVVGVIEDLIAPRLIGRDVFDRQGILDDMASVFKAAGQRGLFIQALSGIDMAIWDVIGRALGKPIYRLLGGVPMLEVPAYATGLYYHRTEPKNLLARRLKEVEGYLARGFKGIKMKIGGLAERADLDQVEKVRRAVGEEACLMVDANQAYDRQAARRVGHALDSLDVFWFEEPLPNEDLVGFRELRSAVRVPIAGGELDSTRFAFRDILAANALDIIQPDLTMVGGFSEAQRIWHLAEASHVLCYPHVWGSAIALTAALHFVATLPPARIVSGVNPIAQRPALEFDQTPNPLRDHLLTDVPVLQNGTVRVPDSPGLGIDVDASAIQKYRIR